ncbi:hypothetical protein SCUCBS95973_005580 [Sporothrix curviconia]|uniref:Tetratricopeptide repeat protein 15 n=1 Tax=Sporothrix curviconia TaxID=1260050 RepID=A0ABP0C072_9PEZI
MDGARTPTDGKGHVRNKSSTKATRPRSSTKGPLDVDDSRRRSPGPGPGSGPGSPMSPTSPSSANSRQAAAASPPLSRGSGLGIDAALAAAAAAPPPPPTPRAKDFSYLLRSEIYHPLAATAGAAANVPQPFRDASDRQPNPDETVGVADDAAGTLLADLLAAGHFRAAAIVAARQLVATPDPTDHTRIFALLYTRLACLLLLDATSLAAQEAKALEDLNSPFYRGEPVPGAGHDARLAPHLVPWELRALHVRLQALGFGDPRRAVMSYYELAREARIRIGAALAAHDNSARELWKGRLAELGIQVAGALIEMDDLAGAAAHLTNMGGDTASQASQTGTSTPTHASRRIAMARALLWLQLGDVEEARAAMGGSGSGAGRTVESTGLSSLSSPRVHGSSSSGGDDIAARVVDALCDMADGEYTAALSSWRALREDAPNDEMVGINLAVCLLYVGQMQEGRAVLEALVDAGASSHTLLFNLSTMYELCTDRAKALKLALAQRVANQMPAAGQGWEKTNADFKL